MSSLAEAFTNGVSTGDRLASNIQANQNEKMRIATQNKILASKLGNEQVKNAISQQRADAYSYRSGLDADGNPPDPSASLPDGIDLPAALAASGAGRGAGGGGGTRSGGGKGGDPIADAMDNYRLLVAGGAAKSQVDDLSGKLAGADALLAKTPSTDDTRAALEAQRAQIAAGLKQAQTFQQAVALTGSSRLVSQLPKDKQGNLRPDLMTDAQKVTASQVGLALPAPVSDDDTADSGPAGALKTFGALSPDQRQQVVQTLPGGAGAALASASGLPVGGSGYGALPASPAPTAPVDPATGPTPPGASVAPVINRAPNMQGGPADGTTATNPKTGQKLVRFQGNWIPAQ